MSNGPDFELRRRNLAKLLPENGVAIITSGSEVIRNGDAHYPFRQNSNFYYLTGFNEPDAVLLIYSKTGESILFNRAKDPLQEQWTGLRLGQEDACKVLKVQRAYPIDTIDAKLPELLLNMQVIYYTLGVDLNWDTCIMRAYHQVRKSRGVMVPDVFYDISVFLNEMRLFKEDIEIDYMRKAALFSVKAHQRAMKKCKNLRYEYELEAEIVYELSRNGCRSVAYDSIVAGGANACILHYTQNQGLLKSGELVLIDAGGEYKNYAADITRTYPINGCFSFEQSQIYDLVLSAQQAAIACLRPGTPWKLIQQEIVKVITQGLVDLEILHGTVDDLIEQQAYKPFYMHNSGHWLGLDVHDVGNYYANNQSRLLAPRMALTVEPGLYLSSNVPGLEERWWGIGVRIEDDFIITPDGYENLTAKLLSNRQDLEVYICD